ncbi:anaerobic benzoate catabolism transcriptional regulator [compost metagenome]
MKHKNFLTLNQMEETQRPLRRLAHTKLPSGGWIRTIREALGMTRVQLARRINVKPQTLADLEAYEATGKITLESLNKLAKALDCRVVYAVIPSKPLAEVRRDRARALARRQLERVSHSMKLEAQGVGVREEKRQFQRIVEELLNGNPKKLWD